MDQRELEWQSADTPRRRFGVTAPYERIEAPFRPCEGDERLERIFGDCRWAEGPVYVPAWRSLIFSDIPNDRMLRWDELTGVVGVFRQPAGFVNGGTLDRNGRLVSCEQGGRRISRLEHDGTITTIVDRVDAKRFNSPNDVVVRSDGTIWFTDPSYGIDGNYEGEQSPTELDGCHVYRTDPTDGSCVAVATNFVRPNGLAFSADERQLFIVDTRQNHIRRFDVTPDATLSDAGVFATGTVGQFDGIRLDESGHIWAAAGDGVHCFDHDGTLLGKIKVPEPAVANICFGGPRRNRLFICATTSVYAIDLGVRGLR